MVDSSEDDDYQESLREQIRKAVAESSERELIEIDFSGPQVTVVVDDESKAFAGGEHLEWSYLGPVEQDR
ncbi:MAG: hypothetical protein V5A38_13885 [Halolamina sp.]|uniref:hypothetical protein n=1 Tax=Halolamina sp. TaxID=1940283 RepID=UPI002FC385D9